MAVYALVPHPPPVPSHGGRTEKEIDSFVQTSKRKEMMNDDKKDAGRMKDYP
jgi:hypothetical protein